MIAYDADTLRRIYRPEALREIRRLVIERALETRSDRDYRWSRFLKAMNRQAVAYALELRRAEKRQPTPKAA